jgi:septal ring factor EnvC (AmiA/AmiB activator)
VPNCPECTAREKKKIQSKYEEETPEEDRQRDDLFKLYDEIEYPMKMDSATKHFICKRCGLYATREQVSEVSDIRYKLNQRERTREDRQDDYLEWWQKSKKDKELV